MIPRKKSGIRKILYFQNIGSVDHTIDIFLHIKNFEDDWLDFLRDIGPEDIWGHSSVKETFLLLHIRRTNDVTRMGEEEEGSQPW